jgi:hypothetical protein
VGIAAGPADDGYWITNTTSATYLGGTLPSNGPAAGGTGGSGGSDPGNGLPEVPSVVLLPLLAAAILGGSVLVRRRHRPAHRRTR